MTICEAAQPHPEAQARAENLAEAKGGGPSFGFARLSALVSALAGWPIAFAVALAIIIIWAVSGPVFHLSDSWRLVINAGTTIIVFLMVFINQSAQNSGGMATQVKLDEPISTKKDARDKRVGGDNMDDVVVGEIEAGLEARAGSGTAAWAS